MDNYQQIIIEDNYEEENKSGIDEQKIERRAKRLEQMKKQKQRQEMIRKYQKQLVVVAGIFAVLMITIVMFVRTLHAKSNQNIVENDDNAVAQQELITQDKMIATTPWEFEYSEPDEEGTEAQTVEKDVFAPVASKEADGFGSDIISEYGIFIDVENQQILAQKNAYEKMYPASMTKILTTLVAAEHITDLEDTFTITIEITDYSFSNDCSCTGFDVGETVTVEDLLYGTILPSGADAALGLAYYVAGSQEAFVELMNEKVTELGLSETTHFTNCVGVYGSEHYSTAYDMALILKAATENELCRKVMSAHTYTTSQTEQHPEGITISNWFLRRIEDKDTHGEILCAKTGYVTQSGNCSASLGIDQYGKEYICVTGKSSSVWKCIADQTILYAKYMEEANE